jgi:hypothetical protein
MATKSWPITKVVEVHWFDACAKSGWDSTQEYLAHDIAPVVSIGYLLKETKQAITLVQSQVTDWHDCSAAISIPKSWIVKMKVLRR